MSDNDDDLKAMRKAVFASVKGKPSDSEEDDDSELAELKAAALRTKKSRMTVTHNSVPAAGAAASVVGLFTPHGENIQQERILVPAAIPWLPSRMPVTPQTYAYDISRAALPLNHVQPVHTYHTILPASSQPPPIINNHLSMPLPVNGTLPYPPFTTAMMPPNFYPPRNIVGNFYSNEQQSNHYLTGPPPLHFFPQNSSVPENVVPSSNRSNSNLIVVPMEPTEGQSSNQVANCNVGRFSGPPPWINRPGFTRPPGFRPTARERGYPNMVRQQRMTGYQTRGSNQQVRGKQNGSQPQTANTGEGLKGLLPQDKWASADTSTSNLTPTKSKKDDKFNRYEDSEESEDESSSSSSSDSETSDFDERRPSKQGTSVCSTVDARQFTVDHHNLPQDDIRNVGGNSLPFDEVGKGEYNNKEDFISSDESIPDEDELPLEVTKELCRQSSPQRIATPLIRANSTKDSVTEIVNNDNVETPDENFDVPDSGAIQVHTSRTRFRSVSPLVSSISSPPYTSFLPVSIPAKFSRLSPPVDRSCSPTDSINSSSSSGSVASFKSVSGGHSAASALSEAFDSSHSSDESSNELDDPASNPSVSLVQRDDNHRLNNTTPSVQNTSLVNEPISKDSDDQKDGGNSHKVCISPKIVDSHKRNLADVEPADSLPSVEVKQLVGRRRGIRLPRRRRTESIVMTEKDLVGEIKDNESSQRSIATEELSSSIEIDRIQENKRIPDTDSDETDSKNVTALGGGGKGALDDSAFSAISSANSLSSDSISDDSDSVVNDDESDNESEARRVKHVAERQDIVAPLVLNYDHRFPDRHGNTQYRRPRGGYSRLERRLEDVHSSGRVDSHSFTQTNWREKRVRPLLEGFEPYSRSNLSSHKRASPSENHRLQERYEKRERSSHRQERSESRREHRRSRSPLIKSVLSVVARRDDERSVVPLASLKYGDKFCPPRLVDKKRRRSEDLVQGETEKCTNEQRTKHKHRKLDTSSLTSSEKKHKDKRKKKFHSSKTSNVPRAEQNITDELVTNVKISRRQKDLAIESVKVKNVGSPLSAEQNTIASETELQTKRTKVLRLVGADSVLIGGRQHDRHAVEKEEKEEDKEREKAMLIMNRKGDVSTRLKTPREERVSPTNDEVALSIKPRPSVHQRLGTAISMPKEATHRIVTGTDESVRDLRLRIGQREDKLRHRLDDDRDMTADISRDYSGGGRQRDSGTVVGRRKYQWNKK